MHILVISKNSLWLESFLSLANNFSQSLLFGQSDKKYHAVVLNIEGLEPRAIDRLLERHRHHPIFFVGNRKKIRKKYRGKVTFIPSEIEVSKIVFLIELCLGRGRLIKRPALSLKEELVLNFLYEGMTNKEISRYSGLPLSSIKYCLPSLYAKLKVKRRSELALLNGEIIV